MELSSIWDEFPDFKISGYCVMGPWMTLVCTRKTQHMIIECEKPDEVREAVEMFLDQEVSHSRRETNFHPRPDDARKLEISSTIDDASLSKATILLVMLFQLSNFK